MKKSILLLLPVLLTACFKAGPDPNEEPVAKVYDLYLYKSQLQDIVIPGVTSDSIGAVKQKYIRRWIYDQLLLHEAEKSMQDYERELQRKLDAYRTTLLIHHYKQNYIKQNLDTVITDKEIENYYEQARQKGEFILNQHILKGLFLIVPRSTPNSWQARSWYKSDDHQDFLELEKYCVDYGVKMAYFEEEWYPLDAILDTMPVYLSPERLLTSRTYYESMDTANYFWLKISDYKLKGTMKPLEIVKDDIKNILLNIRKSEKIRDLERDLYNDASNRGDVTEFIKIK